MCHSASLPLVNAEKFVSTKENILKPTAFNGQTCSDCMIIPCRDSIPENQSHLN